MTRLCKTEPASAVPQSSRRLSMSMMFNALRALEMEQCEQQRGPLLSEVNRFASTLSSDDLSAFTEPAGQPALSAAPVHERAAIGRFKMDREQWEKLRRQVEEDYRLDIAAIERLQRRYPGTSSSVPTSAPGRSAFPPPSERAGAESRIETPEPPSPPSAPAEQQSDDWRRLPASNVQGWPQGARR
jgi:hypothetical protein